VPVNELLVLALRASSGRHSEAARNILLTILLARLLAEAAHDGPPHAARRPAGHGPAPRSRLPHRSTTTGRRPRG
jgi:hypothetical protein